MEDQKMQEFMKDMQQDKVNGEARQGESSLDERESPGGEGGLGQDEGKGDGNEEQDRADGEAKQGELSQDKRESPGGGG